MVIGCMNNESFVIHGGSKAVRPKAVIESHIPYIPEELAQYFDIVRLAPDEITADAVSNADALIVRTRTRCDKALLDNSKCRFVATATIGTDHLDLPWLAARNIEVASAPGCNAPAVAQYVLASLLSLFPEGLGGKTLGVVGAGNVGSIIIRWAQQLGMQVLVNDPPRQAMEQSEDYVSLDTIIEDADIITFHTPHTVEGPFATHHLADRKFFASLQRKPVIVNSARGPITETAALIEALDNGLVSAAVIDCWEGEPTISRRLLQRAAVATPHIAGYSLNGKIRATMATVNAMCRHFDIPYRMKSDIPSGAVETVTPQAILQSYNPMNDSTELKNCLELSQEEAVNRFELLRNKYPLRAEVVSSI